MEIIDIKDTATMGDFGIRERVFFLGETGEIMVFAGVEDRLGWVKIPSHCLEYVTLSALERIKDITKVVEALAGAVDSITYYKNCGNFERHLEQLRKRGEPYTSHFLNGSMADLEILEEQNYFDVPSVLLNHLRAIRSAYENKPNGYVYVLQSDSGYWKIGRSVNPADRLKTFEVKLPFMVQYEMVIPHHDHVSLEAELHERFSYCRVRGEWFDLTDGDIIDLKREFENIAEQYNAKT